MKKLLLLFLLIVNLAFGKIGKDKYLHITGTFIISSISSNIAKEHGFSKKESIVIGVISGMTIGLLKEVYDSRKGGTGFSKADLVADGVGSVLGTIPIFFKRF